jgi:hypothetical protein
MSLFMLFRMQKTDQGDTAAIWGEGPGVVELICRSADDGEFGPNAGSDGIVFYWDYLYRKELAVSNMDR